MSQAIARQDNVIRYLDHWARQCPEKPAIIYPLRLRENGTLEDQVVSYGELAGQVDRTAAALRARGLQRGDRVVVMIPMSLELYTLLLALLKLAVVIVFIDPWVGLPQIKRCIDLTEPKAFAGVPLIHLLGRLSGALQGVPMRLTARGRARFGEIQLEALLSETHPVVETEAVSPETTALITFTTGSTGMPKGANRTHGFLVAQHLALARELQLTPEDVDMPALPIFILNNLAAGVTSVVPHFKPSRPADVNPAVIVAQLRQHQVTTAVGSPAYFMPIAEYCLEQGITLPDVRGIFTGGGPVPPGLLGKLRMILPHGKAYVGYGSTEAEPVALAEAAMVVDETGPQTEEGRGNCVGHLAEGIRAKIIRIIPGPVELGSEGWQGVETPAGEPGELIVTGDHVGKDYYRNPGAVQENKIRDPDGLLWHRMGDVVRFDAQGRVWVVGRVNNVVTRAGTCYYPIETEAIAHQLPFIERAAMIGLGDPQLGQRLVFIIQPKELNFVQWLRKRKEWELRIKSHLATRQIPVDAVYFARRMPVDPRHNVKIDYGLLQRKWAAR